MICLFIIDIRYRGINTLNGYISGVKSIVDIDGVKYMKTVFQGEHKDEYSLIQQKDNKNHGKAFLYKYGVVTCSWNYENGVVLGGYTYYENGKAVQTDYHNVEENLEYSYFYYPKKVILVIYDNETKNPSYIGDFRQGTMIREGKGYEMDVHTKNPRIYGEFKDNECVFVNQQFTSASTMIEYTKYLDGPHPEYSGGCIFDDTTKCFVRHGDGCKLQSNGLANVEGHWDKGQYIRNVYLEDGFYSYKEKDDKPAPPSTGFSFTFGAKKDDRPAQASTPSFKFGTKKDDRPAQASTGFSFGAKKDDKPAPPSTGFGFSFGGKKDDKPTPPSFGSSFGGKKDDKPTPPSFGSSNTNNSNTPYYGYNRYRNSYYKPYRSSRYYYNDYDDYYY